MNNRNPNAFNSSNRRSVAKPTSGVLGAIANGLSLVLVRPYLIVLPIIVDLVIWLGVQISVKPLTNSLDRFMRDYGGSSGPDAADQISRLGDWLRLNDLIGFFLPSLFGGLPKETSVNWLVLLLAPALADGVDRKSFFDGYGNGPLSTWEPSHSVGVVTLGIGLILISTLLLVLFRMPIARTVRGRKPFHPGMTRELVMTWLSVLGLILLAIFTFVALLIPVTLLVVVSLIFGYGLASLVAIILLSLLGMATIYLIFVLDAILLYHLWPLDAVRLSYRVVKGRFGECLRFALTCLFIQTGLLQVWNVLIENPPGIAISLVGNAFFGAGIVAASMIFFSDRISPADRPLQHHARTS
ncbi:MAG TPA: hypothetical protein VFQ54_08235 [Thermomicrobiales bacterium]|nr:hypothetical protein [Thermomicrobiales bacterium]